MAIVVLPDDLSPADKLRLLFADRETSDEVAEKAFLNFSFPTSISEAELENTMDKLLDSLKENRPELYKKMNISVNRTA